MRSFLPYDRGVTIPDRVFEDLQTRRIFPERAVRILKYPCRPETLRQRQRLFRLLLCGEFCERFERFHVSLSELRRLDERFKASAENSVVRGLADAIYAGATLDVCIGEQTMRLESRVKQYQRQVSHDGVYAEATLLATDETPEAQPSETPEPENHEDSDEKQEEIDPLPRKCIIFCPENDRDRGCAQPYFAGA